MSAETAWNDRLRSESERLHALTRVSSILTVRSEGDPPSRHRLVFRGRGLARSNRAGEDREAVFLEEHAVEVSLSRSFPQTPPELRWQTPILHPNVAESGVAAVRDLGLAWDERMTLDAVCEAIWDAIRLANFTLDAPINPWAKRWLETQRLIELPVDRRSLRDLWRGGPNVIPYERRQIAGAETRSIPDGILYLDDDTPEPGVIPNAGHGSARPPWALPPTRRRGDSDVLYIDH